MHLRQALSVLLYLCSYGAVSTGITGAQGEIWSCSLFLCLHTLLSMNIKEEVFLWIWDIRELPSYEEMSRLILRDVALSLH